MAKRPGSHRADHASPLVDLDVVFADDRLIDSIAGADPLAPQRVEHAGGPAGRHSTGSQPAGPYGQGRHILNSRHSGRQAVGIADRPDSGDPLTELFQTWRYELASEPLPPVPSVHRAADAVVSGREQRKRSLRPALSVAAAIAALLIGSATVGSKDAEQDSALWGITQVLWPDRAVSVASRDHVREALDEASKAIGAGDTQQAQLALLRAAVELGKVADVDGRGGMQQRVDDLWRKAAPRELSGTSLTADPMTEQMVADGPPVGVPATVAGTSTSAARQAVSSPPGAPPAEASRAGVADLTGPATNGSVPQVSSGPVTPAGPVVAGSSNAGNDSVSAPTGGGMVSSAGTVDAPLPAGPSSPPITLPAIVLPAPVSTPAPMTSPAPATPTPPAAMEPPPVEVPSESASPAPTTIGSTAPAPAPAPTTTTGVTPTTTTPATGITPTTTTPAGSGGSELLPQPPAGVSSAG